MPSPSRAGACHPRLLRPTAWYRVQAAGLTARARTTREWCPHARPSGLKLPRRSADPGRRPCQTPAYRGPVQSRSHRRSPRSAPGSRRGPLSLIAPRPCTRALLISSLVNSLTLSSSSPSSASENRSSSICAPARPRLARAAKLVPMVHRCPPCMPFRERSSADPFAGPAPLGCATD